MENIKSLKQGYQEEESLKELLNNLLGTFLGLFGFVLLILLYKENEVDLKYFIDFSDSNYLNKIDLLFRMGDNYLSDMVSFATQSANYINKVGYSFSNFLTVYGTFAKSFSNILAMGLIYIGLYIKQKNGTPLYKVLKIATNAIIIFGTAILLGIVW